MGAVWIEHTSNDRPVPRNVWVDVMRFDGTVDYAFPAFGWNWSKIGINGPINYGIAAYRVSSYQPESV